MNVLKKGEMSLSQKQAIVTLIKKKGKDRSLLENWRPISLLNVDAKIMSKVVAARLKMFFQTSFTITRPDLLKTGILVKQFG